MLRECGIRFHEAVAACLDTLRSHADALSEVVIFGVKLNDIMIVEKQT